MNRFHKPWAGGKYLYECPQCGERLLSERYGKHRFSYCKKVGRMVAIKYVPWTPDEGCQTEETFEGYLRANLAKGDEFRLVVMGDFGEGQLKIYCHPLGGDGTSTNRIVSRDNVSMAGLPPNDGEPVALTKAQILDCLR